MAEIRWARVGGPPENWQGLRVFDLDAGEEIHNVVECDVDAGFVLHHVLDDEGYAIPNAEKTDALVVRREGRFEIRYPS